MAIEPKYASQFRECLYNCDVVMLQKLWAHFFSGLPQPKGPDEMRMVMHHARTGADSIPIHKRMYSHAWLRERGHPSALPKLMKPKAEQKEAIVVRAIGMSVGTMSRNPERREEAKHLEKIMGDAGAEMLDAGITDKEQTVAYMWQKRNEYLAGKHQRQM